MGEIGRFNLDVTSPGGLGAALKEDAQQANNFFDGINQALFSERAPSALGHIPLLGVAGRLLGNTVGGIGQLAGNTVDAAVNVTKYLPADLGQAGGSGDVLKQKFAAIPASPEKAEVEAAIKADPWTAGHQMSEFHREYIEAQQWVNPKLAPELETPPGSLADTLGGLIGVLGLATRFQERQVAQMPKILSGMNRLQEIEAVHKGAVYVGGGAGNTEIEEHAYTMWESGAWTPEQALDFLSASGAGFSHIQALEIAGQVAFDPTVVGSFGASLAARGTATAVKLAAQAPGTLARAASPAKLLVEAAGVTRPGAEGVLKGARQIASLERQLARAPEAGKGVLEMQIEKRWGDLTRLAQSEGSALTTKQLRGAVADALDEGRPLSGLNVIGHLAETRRISTLVQRAGKAYTPLQEGAFGQGAGIMRNIIDPLHAIGGGRVVGESTVAYTAEQGMRAMAEASSPVASFAVMRDLKAMGLLDSHIEDLATYTGNFTRSLLLRLHVAASLTRGLGKELVNLTPGEIKTLTSGLLEKAPKDWATMLKDELIKVREMHWDDAARQNLAERMATYSGKNTPEEWLDLWKTNKVSAEYLSILHASTYGRATTGLLNAMGKATVEIGQKAAAALKIDRLILLNRTTLTNQFAEGLLKALDEEALAGFAEAGFKSADEMAAKLIRDAQGQFPSLNYVPIDPKSLSQSIDRFVKNLKSQLDRQVLPTRVMEDEIKKLPQALRDEYAKMHGSFSFGIRPADDLMLGLGKDAKGELFQEFAPWADHVAVATPAYRGSFAMAHNAAGMPLIGTKVGKALDYMEAGAQTLASHVTSAAVTSSARTRFVRLARERHPELTEGQARDIIGAIEEAAGLHEITPRGLSAKNMWQAAELVLPDEVRVLWGTSGKREVLKLVLDAYEGDLRFVGLTQKFSGRAKAWLSLDGNINFAGVLSEDLYQKIRFKINPVFLTQERIEPWVLNAMRGANPAFGNKLTKTDSLMAVQNQRMADTSLMRAGDIDQAEFSRMAFSMADLEGTLSRITDPGLMAQAIDVGGAKRLGVLRTQADSLGRSMRMILDEHDPGMFDRVAAHYAEMDGTLVSDADVAVRWLSGADDVVVPGTVSSAEEARGLFRESMVSERNLPADIGELRGLDLDGVVKRLDFPLPGGRRVIDDAGMRKALADKSITMSRVEDTMRALGYHPDFIRRAGNAWNFHYVDFWDNVRKTYKATNEEIKSLQGMFEETARMRGMTPVDYISQVFAPMIQGGEKAAIESLASGVSILRAGKDASVDDLVTQMAEVFQQHLDPSARAIMDGTGIAEALRATDVPPTGVFEEVTDVAKGVQEVRDVAAQYMEAAGLRVPPRRFLQVDEDFGKRTAKAYEALPSAGAGPVKPGKPVTQAMLEKTSTKMKSGGDPATRAAYQAFVDETRAQYDAIRKAGIEIVPTNTNPYANSAAMVADVRDNKRLLVFNAGSYHPLMTDAQNVMFRGVHDYFAHAAEGFQFGPRGEANAAVKHSQMYSEEARRAMLTETHGQNSVVNFSDTVVDEAPVGVTDDAGGFPPVGATTIPDSKAASFEDLTDEVAEVGEPGVRVETDFSDTPMVVARDAAGSPTGIMALRHGADGKLEYLEIAVSSGSRRKGVATSLFREAERAGYDVESVSGAAGTGITKSGLAFLKARRAKAGAGIGELTMDEQKAMREYLFYLGENSNLRGLKKTASGKPFGTVNQQNVDAMDAIFARAPRLPATTLYRSVSPEEMSLIKASGGTWTDPAYLSTARSAKEAGRYNTGGVIRIEVPDGTPGLDIDQGIRSQLGLGDNYGEGFKTEEVLLPRGARFSVTETPEGLTLRMEPPAAAPTGIEAIRAASEARKAKIAKVVGGGERPIEYARTDGGKSLITEDIRRPGHWRLTSIQADGTPFGHMEADTFEEAVTMALDDSRNIITETPPRQRTIAEINKEKPGSIYAEQKAGLLPQEILDEFAGKYVGKTTPIGTTGSADQQRVMRWLAQWSEEALAKGLLKDSPKMVYLRTLMKGAPTEGGVPFNLTHQLLVNQVGHAMRMAAEDAHRLQYFARNRTFIERSLNHPFFGLYPVSYMWGKVLPEMARFIAREPFGVRTGGLAYTFNDIQHAVALQREFDPDFEAEMDKIGHSETAWFGGFMFPAVPWDIGASAPAAARDLAQQGLANQVRVDRGLLPKPIDFIRPIERIGDYISPARPFLQAAGPLEELGGAISGEAEPTPTPAPAATPAVPVGPTPGASLGPTLQSEIDVLRALLAGQ